MKKIVGAILVVLCIFVLTINVISFDANTPTFTVDSKQVYTEHEVEVSIRMTNNPGVSSVKLEVSFDDDLTLTGIEYNDEELEGYHLNVNEYGLPIKNSIYLNWINIEKECYGDAVFATLTFAVAENASTGIHTIEISYDEDDVFNLSENNVHFEVINGSLEVIKYNHVSSVEITPNETTIDINETKQLTTTILPSNATDKTLEWYSSDDKVVTVDQNGLIKGIKKGNATITARSKDGEKVGTCAVTVYCSHNYGRWTISEDGSKHFRTCSICNETETEDHSWNDGVITTQPTCMAKGIKTYTCSKCNATYTEDVNAIGHDYKFDSFIFADNGKTAQAKYVCSHDSSHVEYHNATVTSGVKVAPTCTEKGTTTYTATYDGHTDTRCS